MPDATGTSLAARGLQRASWAAGLAVFVTRKGPIMPADHVTQRTFAPVPSRRGLPARPAQGQGMPPFWWFLPAVALGLAFWIGVLALLLG